MCHLKGEVNFADYVNASQRCWHNYGKNGTMHEMWMCGKSLSVAFSLFVFNSFLLFSAAWEVCLGFVCSCCSWYDLSQQFIIVNGVTFQQFQYADGNSTSRASFANKIAWITHKWTHCSPCKWMNCSLTPLTFYNL